MRTRLYVLVFEERNIMDVISARIWLTASGIAKKIHTSLNLHTGKGFFPHIQILSSKQYSH